MNKLYSPKEVLEMFPEGQRTSLRRLVKTAKIVDEIYGHLEQTQVHNIMRELSRKK